MEATLTAPTTTTNSWNGGVSPFKVSWGKLMMWYFLLGDSFSFASFLVTYGALRFSYDSWPVPNQVFKT
ncbi:MAG: cytochrome oxidase subunit III, partial [Bacteroidota bacterium]